MKTLSLLVAALALATVPAAAQTRTFYDAQGRFAGTETRRGASRSFYDSSGGFAGSAIRHGNSTSVYDSQGRFVGSSTSTGPRQ